MKKKATVVVGLSGGVDSSVAAYLLKQQGYQVIGLFMKNWEDEVDSKGCTAQEDFEDVTKVCKTLDIPYYTVNFVKEYREKVFEEFLQGYASGDTPNPDILCNREIKFKHFYHKAKEIGADYLATGHYARVVKNKDELYELHKAKDLGKDQSYFLYTLKASLLSEVLFPLGDLLKSEVRKIAKDVGLCVSEKKDSTGICFIGEKKFTPFLKRYLSSSPGPFMNLSGKVLGKHAGVCYYTPGQRKGIGLGGEGAPWYVVDKDVKRNIVYVERGEHPALYSEELQASDISWVDEKDPLVDNTNYEVKIRYRQEPQEAKLQWLGENCLEVLFSKPQRAIALQQALVVYRGTHCLGGGKIVAKGSSYFHQNKPLPLAVSR